MAKYLPERIFPLRLANLGQHLVGTIALDQMPRLTGEHNRGKSPQGKGDVHVDLRFECTEQSSPHMTGKVGVRLTFVCQRCLELVDIDVEATVDLGLVRETNKDTHAGDQDYLELSEESLKLATLVEDELILALPIIPTHPDGFCEAIEALASQSEESGESPFAVLSNLKKQYLE